MMFKSFYERMYYVLSPHIRYFLYRVLLKPSLMSLIVSVRGFINWGNSTETVSLSKHERKINSHKLSMLRELEKGVEILISFH